eukprot:g34959.t1
MHGELHAQEVNPSVPQPESLDELGIHSLLKTRHASFKSEDPYRKSRYDLRKAIRDPRRQYCTKLEAQLNLTHSCRLWQGLNNTMEYKMKQSKMTDKEVSLPDVLNAFYAQFEQNARSEASTVPTGLDTPVPSVTAANVRSVFLEVNPRNATGPETVPGQPFRSCADLLAEGLTDIFSLSLLQAKVPTCFKNTTIIPATRKADA